MFITVLILLGSMFFIFLAAIIFVNAIEYVGCHLHLGGSFVGAVLAPLFTSFPELTVFLVALFAHSGQVGEEIGIGTIFGQPFMASSFSYGLVGLAVIIGFIIKRRKSTYLVVDKSLAIPYVFITILFPLTLVPALLSKNVIIQYLTGSAFIGSFILYIGIMYHRKESELLKEASQTYFQKVCCQLMPTVHPFIYAGFQLLIAIGLLYLSSTYLVKAVAQLAIGLTISPLGLALIVVPAATAIPETASALIWGFKGMDTLSIGSLVGEKILYSTFYPGLGLFLTSWSLDIYACSSVLATTVISIILLIYILKQRIPWYGMCFGLIFFVVYAVMIFD